MHKEQTALRNTPNHRQCAVVGDLRELETPEERALDYLLSGILDGEVSQETLSAVTQAWQSYQDVRVRALFNACLLGGATPEQLEEVFHVSVEETAAYTHLFFDVSVFQNSFHVFGYIAGLAEESERALLQEGYTKGFRALQFRYAPAPEALSPETVLGQVFEANAREYIRQQAIVPPTSKAAAGLRALNKQVLAEAQALDKLGAGAKAAAAAEKNNLEFIIQTGPSNPTLEDLLRHGAELAH